MLAADATAQAVLALPGGALVDRWDRRRVMLACEATQVIALASLVAALVLDGATVVHLVAVAAVLGACRALFEQYEQARAAALPSPVSGPITRPAGVRTRSTAHPIKGLAKAPLLHTMEAGARGMVSANNVRQNGKWEDDGAASGPTPKNAVRDLQLLNHISQLLLSVVESTEIEAMVVNDRILVSANEAAKVREMLGMRLSELAADYQPTGDTDYDRKAAKLAATINTVSDVDDRLGERRMAQVAVDTAIFPDQEPGVVGLLATLSQAYLKIVDGGPPANAATYIGNPAYAGRIIAVAAPESNSPTTCVHAEQSLLLTLAHAGWSGPATIAGGKRPCTFCYVSLRLVQRRLCPQLRFNHHPGGVWTGTTATGITGLAEVLGLDLRQTQKEIEKIRSEIGQQYVSDPRRTAPPTAPVTGLGTAVGSKSRGYRTDTGTPSQSDVDDSSPSSSDVEEEEVEYASSQSQRDDSHADSGSDQPGPAGDEEEEEEDGEETFTLNIDKNTSST